MFSSAGLRWPKTQFNIVCARDAAKCAQSSLIGREFLPFFRLRKVTPLTTLQLVGMRVLLRSYKNSFGKFV